MEVVLQGDVTKGKTCVRGEGRTCGRPEKTGKNTKKKDAGKRVACLPGCVFFVFFHVFPGLSHRKNWGQRRDKSDSSPDPAFDPAFNPTCDPALDLAFDPARDPAFDPAREPPFDPPFDPASDPPCDPAFKGRGASHPVPALRSPKWKARASPGIPVYPTARRRPST
jgi:hypothetical protein